jgi:hypothetical protein
VQNLFTDAANVNFNFTTLDDVDSLIAARLVEDVVGIEEDMCES